MVHRGAERDDAVAVDDRRQAHRRGESAEDPQREPVAREEVLPLERGREGSPDTIRQAEKQNIEVNQTELFEQALNATTREVEKIVEQIIPRAAKLTAITTPGLAGTSASAPGRTRPPGQPWTWPAASGTGASKPAS